MFAAIDLKAGNNEEMQHDNMSEFENTQAAVKLFHLIIYYANIYIMNCM